VVNRIPPHPVSHGVREADARRNGTDLRHQATIEEHQAALERAITEVIGPDWALVSVKEIEDLVYEIENEPARLARRFAAMRRQLKRNADVLQGLADMEERMQRAEETLSRFRAWESV
jgi:hypothetical protein